LALSLLQRKPDEWRRQHATPSSGGGANAAKVSPDKIQNTRLKATAVTVTPDNDNKRIKEDPEEGEAGTSPPEKRRRHKKRKRSAAAADEIDALFDDAIGRKVVRSALEPAAAPAPVRAEETNVDLALNPGRGKIDDHRHAELGAVVDAIKVAPRAEGKKRSKRRLGPA
jgi:hypothetical protein